MIVAGELKRILSYYVEKTQQKINVKLKYTICLFYKIHVNNVKGHYNTCENANQFKTPVLTSMLASKTVRIFSEEFKRAGPGRNRINKSVEDLPNKLFNLLSRKQTYSFFFPVSRQYLTISDAQFNT